MNQMTVYHLACDYFHTTSEKIERNRTNVRQTKGFELLCKIMLLKNLVFPKYYEQNKYP